VWRNKNTIKKAIKVFLIVAIIFIVWFFVVSFFSYYNVTHPKQTDYSATPANYNVIYEDVYFQTEDNLRLAGWFLPAGEDAQGTIIVLHGYPANKSDSLDWSLFLREKFNLLLFDFRYFGSSEGKYTTIGWNEKKDLKAAVDYLFTRDDIEHDKIGVMGFSVGAAVGIMQGATDDRIKAIVADSSYASLGQLEEKMFDKFGIMKKPMLWSLEQWAKRRVGVLPDDVSVVQAMAQSKTPLLLIHGTADQEIPVEHSRQIFGVTKGSSELWEIEGADHGEAYIKQKTQYEAKVIRFFENNF
jgi:dipeptidyl aminopeptidase/acylaminoacyl peptidase